MTRTPGQAQRARRLLNQATMQRSHRRSELIRLIPDDERERESALLSPPVPSAVEPDSLVPATNAIPT